MMAFLKKLNKTQTKNMFDLENSSTWFKPMMDLSNRIIGECQLNIPKTLIQLHTLSKFTTLDINTHIHQPIRIRRNEYYLNNRLVIYTFHKSIIAANISPLLLLHYKLTKVYKISRNIAMHS